MSMPPYLPTAGVGNDQQLHGLYVAKIVNATPPAGTPAGANLVQLLIPQVLGTATSNWAMPMQPGITPVVGTMCLALFLGGNINAPYYFVGVTPALVEAVSTPINQVNTNALFTGGSTAGYTATGGTMTAVTPNADTNPPSTYGALFTASGTGGGYIQESTAPFNAVIGQPYQMQAWVYYPKGGNVNAGFGWTGMPNTVNTTNVTAGKWTQVTSVQNATASSGYPMVGPAASVAGDQMTAAVISVTGQVNGQLISSSSISSNQVNFTATQIGGITVSASATQPANPKAGDLWYNSAQGYALSQYSGAAWNPYQWGTGAIATGSITAALIAAGTITTQNLNANAINGMKITGAQIIADGATGQVLIYNGPPAAGNLAGAWSGVAGTDAFGNNYAAGLSATQVQMTGAGLLSPTVTNPTVSGGTLSGSTLGTPVISGGTLAESTVTFNSNAASGTGGALLSYATNATTIVIPAGTTSWTAPAGNYTSAKVECWGADAGGGGGNAGEAAEGGGGGAYAVEPNYPLVPGKTYTVAVGKGGTGGPVGLAATSGGSTSFDGSGVFANGGKAGGDFVGGPGGATSSNWGSYAGGNGGSPASGATASAGGGGRAGSAGPGGNGGNSSGSTPGAGGAAGPGVGGIAGGSGVGAQTDGHQGGGGSGAGQAAAGTVSKTITYLPTETVSFLGSNIGNGQVISNTNGSMYQGCSNGQYNVTGDQASVAYYNTNQMSSDWFGWFIDETLLNIQNQNTYYSSGCWVIFGWFDSSFNEYVAQEIFWCANGQFTGLTDIIGVTAMIIAIQNDNFGGIILGPSNATSGGPLDLWNYGYFTGGTGASAPAIQMSGHQGSAGNRGGKGSDGVIHVTYIAGANAVMSSTISPAAGTDASGNSYGTGFTGTSGSVQAFTPGVSPAVVETWHDTTSLLQNGWTVFGTFPVRYRILPDGVVHLFGSLVPPATPPAGQIIFNLPTGYHPTYTTPITAAYQETGNSSACYLELQTGGTLQFFGGSPPAGSSVRINSFFPVT